LGLFPNPTDGVVTLLTPSGGQISVLDLTGRIVQRRTAAVGISPLDLQPLGPGTYVIRCATKAGMVIGRVDLLR
jgi:hypothetical protein